MGFSSNLRYDNLNLKIFDSWNILVTYLDSGIILMYYVGLFLKIITGSVCINTFFLVSLS